MHVLRSQHHTVIKEIGLKVSSHNLDMRLEPQPRIKIGNASVAQQTKESICKWFIKFSSRQWNANNSMAPSEIPVQANKQARGKQQEGLRQGISPATSETHKVHHWSDRWTQVEEFPMKHVNNSYRQTKRTQTEQVTWEWARSKSVMQRNAGKSRMTESRRCIYVGSDDWGWVQLEEWKWRCEPGRRSSGKVQHEE